MTIYESNPQARRKVNETIRISVYAFWFTFYIFSTLFTHRQCSCLVSDGCGRAEPSLCANFLPRIDKSFFTKVNIMYFLDVASL